MKLGKQRCQCIACGEYFNSVKSFDKHRFGDHNEKRYCMSKYAMLSERMEVNKAGFWITNAFVPFKQITA